MIKDIEVTLVKEKKYRSEEFVYSVRSKLFEKIEVLEKNSFEKFFSLESDTFYQLSIKKNIEICKKYSFEVGTNDFNSCILQLPNLYIYLLCMYCCFVFEWFGDRFGMVFGAIFEFLVGLGGFRRCHRFLIFFPRCSDKVSSKSDF